MTDHAVVSQCYNIIGLKIRSSSPDDIVCSDKQNGMESKTNGFNVNYKRSYDDIVCWREGTRVSMWRVLTLLPMLAGFAMAVGVNSSARPPTHKPRQ